MRVKYCLNTYDESAASIAEQTGSVVVSVNYRQGPEFKFPTAHNDCFSAYQWMLANASTIKGDTARVGLLGESAGGNVDANVAIMARDKHIKMPVVEVLVYPIAQSNMNTPSYIKNVGFLFYKLLNFLQVVSAFPLKKFSAVTLPFEFFSNVIILFVKRNKKVSLETGVNGEPFFSSAKRQ